MNKTCYAEIEPYTTKDGSIIRELMHPAVHGNANQSLAEAIVSAGLATRLHRHRRSEEIYHIAAGTGLMRLGDMEFAVHPGDSVCIPPGTPHCIENIGARRLRILCCCSPPYSDDDTELLD